MQLSNKYLVTTLTAMLIALSGIESATAQEVDSNDFPAQSWSKVESTILLNNEEYFNQLKLCVSDNLMLEEWRNRQLEKDELMTLNAKLMASVTAENRLTGEANRNRLYIQRRESEKIRKEINRYWSRLERDSELKQLQKNSKESALTLYNMAVKILEKDSSEEAVAALFWLKKNHSIAIPESIELAKPVKVNTPKVVPMALDDSEMFQKYEKEFLLKDPSYAVLRERSNKAFSILSQWQELQLLSNPDGKMALEAFQSAANEVSRVASSEPIDQQALEIAQANLQAASVNLKDTQQAIFANDSQNKILTDSYYQARAEVLGKAAELLIASEDKEVSELGQRVAASLVDSSRDIAEATENSRVAVRLADWEKKFFSSDIKYLALKSNYENSRKALSTYQKNQLMATPEGAELLAKIDDIEQELKVSNSNSELIAERNNAIKQLGTLYKKALAGDAENSRLQSEMNSAKSRLNRYAIEELSKINSIEANELLQKLQAGAI